MRKSIIVGLISIVLGACQTDLLDKQPLDQLSSGGFWQSEADFQMALTGIYGSLQGGGGVFSYGMPNWDAITDNAYGQHNYWQSQAIVRGEVSPSTTGYISDVYSTSYSGIARTNVFLEKLKQYEGTDFDEQVQRTMEAEARFIRGYYYWMLYFSYGAVPVVTEPVSLEDQYQPKVSEEEVLNQALADIDFAIQNLPSELYNGGHAVATSAQALKARVLLYAAYDDTGTPNADKLTQARDLAVEVINAGYVLDQNFEDVFRDGTQEGNSEILFSIKFLAPDNSTPMDQWYGDWVVLSPLQSFMDAFEGDPRLEKSVFENVVEFDGDIHDPSNNMPTGYGVKKFLSAGLFPYGYATQSQQDWVVLRYAEVLLMFAEAQNELTGPNKEVYETVNEIRSRVGLPNVSQDLDKHSMRELIRKERRIELAFEGLRYYDLKRWRIAEEILTSVTDGILNYNFEERFYQWPLPQSEIDKSQEKLIQNSDY